MGARSLFTHQLPFPIVKGVRTLHLQAAHVWVHRQISMGTWEAGVAESKGCSVQRPEAGSSHLYKAGCHSNGIKSGPNVQFFFFKGPDNKYFKLFEFHVVSVTYSSLLFYNPLKHVLKTILRWCAWWRQATDRLTQEAARCHPGHENMRLILGQKLSWVYLVIIPPNWPSCSIFLFGIYHFLKCYIVYIFIYCLDLQKDVTSMEAGG